MRSKYADLQKAPATYDRSTYDPKTTRRPTPPAIQGCVLTSAPDQRRGAVQASRTVSVLGGHIMKTRGLNWVEQCDSPVE
ncbi:hypothetical protein MHYP_G00084530 [Metynnis hypsauchen]